MKPHLLNTNERHPGEPSLKDDDRSNLEIADLVAIFQILRNWKKEESAQPETDTLEPNLTCDKQIALLKRT